MKLMRTVADHTVPEPSILSSRCFPIYDGNNDSETSWGMCVGVLKDIIHITSSSGTF